MIPIESLGSVELARETLVEGYGHISKIFLHSFHSVIQCPHLALHDCANDRLYSRQSLFRVYSLDSLLCGSHFIEHSWFGLVKQD